MSSREKIMGRLRQTPRPFANASQPTEYLPVTPIADQSLESLSERFIQEARALSSVVHLAADENSAVQIILNLLARQNKILTWDFAQIPCSGLENALYEAGISTAAHNDDSVPYGLTGASAALAATGSLVLVSGPGRPRTAALLPLTHIAVIQQEQILPDIESWMHRQRQNKLAAFHQSANINIISGPSRTADIGMELILGMHGPKALHIIIIANLSQNLPGL